MSAADKLDGQDNRRRRREPGDFMRTGDGSPYWWNGDDVTAAGKPKLRRGGRMSNAGHSIGGSGFALGRYRDRFKVKGVALMFGELCRELGPYPELWDTDDKRTREVLDSMMVEGERRAGSMVKADRGTVLHSVLEAVALDVIAGGTGLEVELDGELIAEAEALGLTVELLEQARSLFAELFASTAIPLASETKAVHPTFNLCGTGDLVLDWITGIDPMVPAGTITGADLKTGRVDGLTVLGQAAQLAGYFGEGSMHYEIGDDDDDPGLPVPWPWKISTEHAVILHLPLDEALDTGELRLDLVVVDLLDGRAVLELAAEVSGFAAPSALWPAPGAPALTRQLTDSALLDGLQASIDAVAHERVLEWLHQRLTVIAEHGPALELLIELWPDEVPRGAIRDRELDPELVNPMHRLLSHVEAETHLPFPPRDPRTDLPNLSRWGSGSTTTRTGEQETQT